MPDNAEPSAEVPAAAKPATKARRPAKRKAATAPANLSAPSGLAARKHPVREPAFGKDWWQRGVIYQVYPRSFADSNGDGIGDLPGLIAKLDYLNDGTERSLGIDAIWLSPIHPSPGFDVGYDVADYDAIDPIYGTLDDFDRLIAEAHRRGIRVMLDLVMNHSSSAHRWFEESRREPNGPFGDWYLWRDGRPGRFGRKGRPNNWRSFFGGSAWTWDEVRGQYYMHTFLPEQPDLNWRNPAVRAAMLAMVRGWLDRGVDGFRLDVFNAFFKNAEMLSNPRRLLGRRPYDRQVHLYDKDQPELIEFLAEFRALLDSYPERMSVGELFASDPLGATRLSAPGHMVFDWNLIGQPWKAKAFAAATEKHERMFGQDLWPTLVMSNHDQPRQASRLAPDADAATSDAVAQGRRESVVDPPRHPVHLLRRGDRSPQRPDPVGGDRRPARQARRTPDPAPRAVVEPRPGPFADAVGPGPERRIHDGPAMDPHGARCRYPDGRIRGRRSLVRPQRLPQAALAAAAPPGAPGRRVPAASEPFR